MNRDEQLPPDIMFPLGESLKSARLNASLSIGEVAEALNLGEGTIRDIEDDLDNTLRSKRYPTIFLRGYLVNYAKLVALTKLELFTEYQQLEAIQKEKQILRAPELIIPKAKKNSKLFPFIVLVIITIIASLYFFKVQGLTHLASFFDYSPEVLTTKPTEQSVHIVTSPDVTEKATGVSFPILEANNARKVKEVTQHEAMPEKKTVIEVNVEKKKDIEATTLGEAEVVELVITKESNDAVNAQKEFTAPVIKVDAVETNQSTLEIAQAEPVEEVDLSGQPENLMLAFTAECWTEIVDATGKRIAFGLYKGGRILHLSGIAPFQLKLGDPSVVEIQYQDDIIEGDFTPGRSANFTIPL